MAVHDDPVETLSFGGQEGFANPQQIALVLRMHGDAGAQARMHEDVVADLDVELHGPEQAQVGAAEGRFECVARVGEAIERAERNAVGRQSLAAPQIEPAYSAIVRSL